MMNGRGRVWGGIMRVEERSERTDRSSEADAPPRWTWPAVSAAVRRLARLTWRHSLFCSALIAATALRVVTVLAYPGVLWFSDSRGYLGVAVRPAQYPSRPQGYAFFLRLLEPAHSYVLVVVIQHLLILGAAVALYLLMRRRFAVPRWGATLAAVPVLFDGYQLQLEHLMMSDTLFEVLVIAAVVAILWKPRPGWVLCAVAGLAIGVATTTRSIGLPLIAIFALFLLIRQVGWRAFAAAALTCAVPLGAYATWFHDRWGVYGLSNSSGVFLYGRTAAFALCSEVKPPPSQRWLCPEGPISQRTSSPNYVWRVGQLSQITTWHKFTPAMSDLTGDFARRAILAQPLDYVRVVARDFGRTFEWNRHPYPRRASIRAYEFPKVVKPREPVVLVPGATVTSDSLAYAGNKGATPVVSPYAEFVRGYQDHVRLPGTLFGVIMAAGLAGIAVLWRRLGGAALLPWVLAFTLIAVPPLVSAFGYRYVLPAVPLACLAVAIALTEARGRVDRTPPRRWRRYRSAE